VDLLPTLLHITGKPPADWGEGAVLPPYAPSDLDPERNLYVIQARQNAQFEPLTVSTIALIKGQYKLMYFFGYDELGGPGQERIELYDLENDPEELNDLYTTRRETAAGLLDEVRIKLSEVDEPYKSNG
jgi:arylsulfatase A-like enzyme